MTGRKYLLDVSRLIWRRWSGRLSTGIDRVCLEYVEHFGPRSQAVVQYKSGVFVLSPPDTDRLFELIRSRSAGFRRRLITLGPLALARGSRNPPRQGMTYLNVGHTGLDHSRLARWIARNRVRAVYLIHDLIPITHPQFCRPGEAAKHERRILNALMSASGIIANSNATLEDISNFASRNLRMPPATVAWISGPELPEHVVPREQPRPYFVTVGTIEARKNHILLLAVWESLVARLGETAPDLVIIGQRGWEAEDVTAILDHPQSLHGHVHELGRCDDDELASWLAGARALLMPSFAEGFGLPLIEALELGTPVIATDLPVYGEIVGDIPTYLHPLDRAAWERAIRGFTADSLERRRQLTAMASYRAPDWPTHFERVEAWLQRM